MKKYVIFDLDGTLSLINGRERHISGKNKNWKNFFFECDNDLPNFPVIELFKFYRDLTDYTTIIITGRSDEVKEKTLKWLKRFDCLPKNIDYIFMRKKNDFRGDIIFKSEVINKLNITHENTIVVFEDRDRMVQFWRENNFNCFQVSNGDF